MRRRGAFVAGRITMLWASEVLRDFSSLGCCGTSAVWGATGLLQLVVAAGLLQLVVAVVLQQLGVSRGSQAAG